MNGVKRQEVVGYYREYYQDTGIYENRVYDGFEEMLKELKAVGKRLAVATSKPEPYARRIIEHFGLSPYFDYVAGMELERAGADYIVETVADIACL